MPTEYDPQKHHRASIRLQGYDYSYQGAYYITIVTWQREYLLGDVSNQDMELNQYGHLVHHAWFDLPNHYPAVELGTFCIMPNHMHGIIVLNDSDRAGLRPAPTKQYPLSEVVRAFKSFSARQINLSRGKQGIPVWQRNYYEHIIRSDKEHQAIHDYILDNPLNWNLDDLFQS